MKRAMIATAVLLVGAPALAQPTDPYPQTQPPPQPAPQPQPQPYPPAQQPPPPGYYYPPQPQPPIGPQPEPSGELEMIGNFAGLGILASVTLLVERDYDDPGSGTLLIMAGALGGGATGWILADQFEVKRSDAYATTMGMSLGALNAALLMVPLGTSDNAEEILPTFLVGSTAGAVGGLALGKGMNLTRGQTLFAANLALLGIGTSAMAGALIDRDDGEFDPGEMTALAIGLDGGAAAGLILAPKIDWSYRRSRFVSATTLVGTFLGGMIGSLMATERDEETGTSTTDPDTAVSAMLLGMWGGFAGGILMTRDFAPDPRHRKDMAPGPAPSAGVTVAPLIGDHHMGVTAGGTF
jgi:hypothetical protein